MEFFGEHQIRFADDEGEPPIDGTPVKDGALRADIAFPHAFDIHGENLARC